MLAVLGATEKFADINFLQLQAGRFFTETEVNRRRNLVVLGQTPYQALFGRAGLDPIGKKVRVGPVEYTVTGVLGKRPAAGGFDLGQDDFVVIPETTYRRQFGIQVFGRGKRDAPERADCHSAARRAPREKRSSPKSRKSCASGMDCAWTSRAISTWSVRMRRSKSGDR